MSRPTSSFLAPTKRCFPVVHPSSFMNSSNSRTRLLQHKYPFDPSWNTGWDERRSGLLMLYETMQSTLIGGRIEQRLTA